ncbi:MAG: glycosyltransferase [Treponema sp.]|nr:glycosyltransferase [Treponema sp.]
MDERNIDYNGYSIVYGFGYPLEKAFYSDSAEKVKKVYYSTGCSPFYSNKGTALKILKYQKEKGEIIPSSGRLLYHFWTLQIVMPDLNVTLGNQFTVNTYLEINPGLNIKSLPVFYYDVYDICLSQKNFKDAQRHFLWFGSSGLLHKGLDVLIDIFSERNDIFLHICGASKGEKKFFHHYQPIIDSSNNIVDHGFIDIDSKKFEQLMDLCAFVLHPSVSEGGAAATVNVMANGGLIPIVSVSTGLDIEEYGYVFEEINKSIIINKIEEVLKLEEDDLRAKSLRIKSNIRLVYSHQNYKSNLQKILCEGINLECKR